ncbi:MAG TPA: polysaccharide deacetylase [Candidatus Methylomirabilis sp.]|nr:polysaccharide deacetylase [Candidatus Methylomirabilis sp.]
MRPPIRWPPGVRSAVCLTFDLDAETAWISRDAENINRISVLSQGAYGPKVGVPLILDFLDANRLTATFFVPGWTAERHGQTVAEIHRRGHEIGHHGYLHEALEGRSRAEEEEILERTSRILADITGAPPIGYRAPLYEITADTVDLLRGHGFLYASNLLDTLWPYLHPGAPPLVEIPVQWLLDDGPFFAFGLRPPLYRQIFPPSAVLSAWKDEFRGMHPLGGAYTLILHPQYIGRPSRLLMLQELIDYMRTFPGVWFTHGAELARHCASAAAEAGTDGRPLPDDRPARVRRGPARAGRRGKAARPAPGRRRASPR